MKAPGVNHKAGVTLLLIALFAPSWCGAVENIALHALFKDKAIVMIDGTRRVLKAGEASPEGVTLLATDTQAETADIEIGGKREQLRLGVVIRAFRSTGKGVITLYAGTGGHFHADGLINGVAVRFLVDTGATSIAINSHLANRIGLDYQRNGEPAYAQTASGIVRSWTVRLREVSIGDITLHDVEAGVIEGAFPTEALLGMSFLGSLDMRREADRMELRER